MPTPPPTTLHLSGIFSTLFIAYLTPQEIYLTQYLFSSGHSVLLEATLYTRMAYSHLRRFILVSRWTPMHAWRLNSISILIPIQLTNANTSYEYQYVLILVQHCIANCQLSLTNFLGMNPISILIRPHQAKIQLCSVPLTSNMRKCALHLVRSSMVIEFC